MNQPATTFGAFGLSRELMLALDDLNFVTPSPIQEKTLPHLLEGADLIGLAQTGTGKTAAFALPLLQGMKHRADAPEALILAPTRELAIQVADHIEKLARHMKNISIAVLCGGQDYRPQLKKLKDGVNIVVGTPGRVLDHLKRGSLKLDCIKTFVLDEADEMLRMGFIEDVEVVLDLLPEKRQIALFSATMPSRIRAIAKNYLQDPVSVEIKMATATVKSIEQKFLFAAQEQKPGALLRVIAAENRNGVIVFVRTKSSSEDVARLLQQYGHRAVAIHGDLGQSMRERIISQFKQGLIDILVATDVAARGLDVERVTHVINYDIAHDCETYVHRIGRTGRAGRNGVSILFVTPRETRMLNNIERHTREKIQKMNIPDDSAIGQTRKRGFFANIAERLNHSNFPEYRKMLQEFLGSNIEVSALDAAAAVALMLNNDMQFAGNLPEVMREKNREKKPAYKGSAPKSGTQKKPGRKFARDDAPPRKKFSNSKKPHNKAARRHA